MWPGTIKPLLEIDAYYASDNGAFETAQSLQAGPALEPPLARDEIDTMVAAAVLQLSQPPMWENALRRGSMDAFMALLVSRLPNLRRLEMDSKFQAHRQFLALMFGRALNSRLPRPPLPSTFDRLQEVR